MAVGVGERVRSGVKAKVEAGVSTAVAATVGFRVGDLVGVGLGADVSEIDVELVGGVVRTGVGASEGLGEDEVV